MTALLLALSLTLGAPKAEPLVPANAGALQLSVPRGWKKVVEEGSQRWESPDGRQTFSLDVFPVEGTPMGPGTCVDKLVAALGGASWEQRVVGGQPAARRIFQDELEDGRKVITHSHVGCDGRTKWALTYVMDAGRKGELPVKRVVDSIRYRDGGRKR